MSNASLNAAARFDGGGSAVAGMPKLLVSVRNVREARAAIDGGADVIDVKEPRRGSLGMADPDVITAIAECVRSAASGMPVSAALGEMWASESNPSRIPCHLNFAKLGMAGAADMPDWPSRWESLRRRLEKQCGSPIEWVGVAYADVAGAGAPPVEDVIEESGKAGCAGVLIDTFGKSDGRLFDLVEADRLRAWADLAHELNLFFALAGRIAIGDLPRLASISVDVVAVRSAVCLAQQRDAALSSKLVAAFRRELHSQARASRLT